MSEQTPIPGQIYELRDPVPIESHRCLNGRSGLSGGVTELDSKGRPTRALCYGCALIFSVNQKALEIFEMVRVVRR